MILKAIHNHATKTLFVFENWVCLKGSVNVNLSPKETIFFDGMYLATVTQIKWELAKKQIMTEKQLIKFVNSIEA